MDRTIRPGRIAGALTPPCSKSYAQRALAASLLCRGRSRLGNLEFCDDTLAAIRCIETLGATVRRTGGTAVEIDGGLNPRSDTLHVRESGLSTRLFTPIAALAERPIAIVGEGTLNRRPMTMMLGPLRALGVEVHDNGGCLPLSVCGPMRGSEVEVDGSISSQFITGLLLALGARGEETTIRVRRPVSTPYLDITVDTARRFGREISHSADYTEFYIPGGQGYRPADFAIEGDWSAAATWLVGGALAGEVRVEQISSLSKQADTAVCRALERAGASLVCEEQAITVGRQPLRAFRFDATHCPDLFPALVALAAAAEGVSEIRGTSRLKYKESDRAEVLQEEYARLGIEIDLGQEDTLRVRGGRIHGAVCSAHGDHRIAMSLALAALRSDAPVTIRGAECVSKSYPTFFDDLEKLYKG